MRLNVFFLAAALIVGGCGTVADYLAPAIAADGTVTDSVAVETVKPFVPLAGPYGEVVLMALMAVQNGFLIWNRQKKKKQALATP